MKKNIINFIIVCFLIFLMSSCAQKTSLKKISTRPNVNQKFLLLEHEDAKANVILFCGGHGNLEFRGTHIGWGNKNFLVRSRKEFYKHGFNVAVIDAPSDKESSMGLNEYNKDTGRHFRISKEHAEDIANVSKYMKNINKRPVWLVGTSAGSFSAANGAMRIQDSIDGLVLTSSVTKTDNSWDIHESYSNGILNMNLKNIKVPTLVVAHKKDECIFTPPEGAKKIADKLVNSNKVELKYFEGGIKPRSRPCQAMSKHGFIGIEDDVVAYISKFIKNN